MDLRRESNAYFINNYFIEGEATWKLILIYSLFLIIKRLSHTYVLIFQTQKIKLLIRQAAKEAFQ